MKMSCLAQRGSRVLFFGAACLLALTSLSTELPAASQNSVVITNLSQVFQTTNVWTIHLKFTSEQWDAMEPQNGTPSFGGPGGFGGPPGGGPGKDQGGPGGPAEFGPSMFIAPLFLKEGDTNEDTKLSKEEFVHLSEKWFAKWDRQNKGKLNEDALRDGMNAGFKESTPEPDADQGPGMMLRGAEGKRNGLASAMGIEFKYVHADLEFGNLAFKDVAVRYKGNGTFMQSRDSLKRSLKVELNKYVKGQKLAGMTHLTLNNNVTDPSWMNEVLSYRLYRDAGIAAPRTAYAKVYVTVPGKFDRKYFGLYSLVEDVRKQFLRDNFHTAEGALFKPVTPSLFTYLGDDWKKYQQAYDPKEDITELEKQRVIDFSHLVTRGSDADFEAKLGQFIDMDEFARFMAVMVFLSDMDGILGPGQNLYIYLSPKTGKFLFLPWDQDHSFGQFEMRGSQQQRENLSILKPWDGNNRFLKRIFKVDAFMKTYQARLREYSGTLFQPVRFTNQVDEIAPFIRPAIQEESDSALKNFDKVVTGKSIDHEGFFGGFGEPTKPIKPFVKVRAQSIQDQLDNKSKGLEIGFGGPGGNGGGPGGFGGPGGEDFGPGMFLAPSFMKALDADKDGFVTREEFIQGFAKWFESWDTDKNGSLDEKELRSGIDKSFEMPGPPGMP